MTGSVAIESIEEFTCRQLLRGLVCEQCVVTSVGSE